ncbi:unnamed protein product [Amoebophrya sp. A25]|nr:unnamed protein product [Amoebophrya sp. A25]|eukprot:GSA25T00007094001.1
MKINTSYLIIIPYRLSSLFMTITNSLHSMIYRKIQLHCTYNCAAYFLVQLVQRGPHSDYFLSSRSAC